MLGYEEGVQGARRGPDPRELCWDGLHQDVLDALLLRRELLKKLLESQVLESFLSTGVISVLAQKRERVLVEIVNGHAMEVLIDTRVLPALLGC